MLIKNVKFITSSVELKEMPAPQKAEIAFVGRSNVGKSSLINALTGSGKLAKVSRTPGKTQTVNHFEVDNKWFLVDLPGYGFAKVSKKQRAQFQDFIQDYLINRQNLLNVFLLIDSRHTPQPNDLEFIEFLGMHGIPFSIVFTKIDKLTNQVLHENIDTYKKELLLSWEELPPIFLTSSEKFLGLDDIKKYLNEIIPLFSPE